MSLFHFPWSAYARPAFVASLALAGAFAAAPGRADEAAQACGLTVEQARAIAASIPSGSTYAEYGGADAKKILALVNATPPVTAYDDDTVLALTLNGEVEVALAKNGCVDNMLKPPLDIWKALVGRALGDPS